MPHILELQLLRILSGTSDRFVEIILAKGVLGSAYGRIRRSKLLHFLHGDLDLELHQRERAGQPL